MCISRALGIAAAACALAVASACAPVLPRACAGPAAGPPAVELDARPWLRAHPGASLDFCLATSCEALSPGREITTVQAPFQDHAGTYSLTLKSAGRLVAEQPVYLAAQTVAGPCGTVQAITIRALTLDPDGRLVDTPSRQAPYVTISNSP
ncbi:hypothetical protein [Arthrobacter sp. B2a2-09]|uniref:hypothetical protein n=1 Tax=Arthrobacter sp. B2a2-09 TaxID=2952822 RepID=UPI0022CD9F15|nr:hypothetical protein [Arthrobacter sp. B2a2-09]MCZ9884092.1 hypothetical protein [Arthrobacter sp. B2a2-09]